VDRPLPTEQSVSESEKLFRLVANTAPVMIWMSGVDKFCNYFNQPWLDFTGRTIAQETGNGWTEGVHPEDFAQCLETYSSSFDRREAFRMTYRLRRNDGEYRWVLDQGVPRFDWNGAFSGYIGSCIDVTEQKLAEEALSRMNQRLIEVQEEERSRLARELHDDINQRVGLLAVNLERLKQDLPASETVLRQRIADECARISLLASDIQAMSHSLHSSKLQLLGLAAAAKGFCRELQDLEKVHVEFHASDVPHDLPEHISLCLFRVLQEALQNAVKHSHSHRFRVSLNVSASKIALTVRDWGIGFRQDTASKSRGLGLTSMCERLKLVGGECSIESYVGGGTTVHAAVPLQPAERDKRAPECTPKKRGRYVKKAITASR